MTELDAAEKSRHYRKVARLAAELVDDSTVGVLVPAEDILVSRTDELPSLLKKQDPILALKESMNIPVVNASDDEPRMKQAVAEARKTWPQFVSAFRKKVKNTESFGVKFPFDTEVADKKEFMWVEVTSIDEEFVSGQLANDPVLSKDLKLGDPVKKKVSDLSDWMYLQDGEMVGGFSVKILMEQQNAEESESASKEPGKGKASKQMRHERSSLCLRLRFPPDPFRRTMNG